MSGHIVPMETELTLHERFRLIEIAHETSDPEIRKAALRLVCTRRLMMVRPHQDDVA